MNRFGRFPADARVGLAYAAAIRHARRPRIPPDSSPFSAGSPASRFLPESFIDAAILSEDTARGLCSMFGIRGLDSFGLVHAFLGLGALVLALFAVAMPKGTSTHRRIGLAYAGTMLLLNGTGLMIYDLSGRFGPFHIAAVISLATIGAGFVPVYLRRPRDWMAVHAMFMSWSFVGLVAAFISEIAVRVPGVQFGIGTAVATAVVVIGGALLIHTRVPRIVERLARPGSVGPFSRA